MAERSFTLLLIERYKCGNYDWYRQDYFYSYIWPNGIDYVDTGFFQLVILL